MTKTLESQIGKKEFIDSRRVVRLGNCDWGRRLGLGTFPVQKVWRRLMRRGDESEEADGGTHSPSPSIGLNNILRRQAHAVVQPPLASRTRRTWFSVHRLRPRRTRSRRAG